MGFVYSGDVVAQQLFDPADYESRLNGAVLDSVMKNHKPSTSIRYPGSNLADEIVAGFTNNYSKKVNKYLNYGRFKHPDTVPTNININELFANSPDQDNYVAPHEDVKPTIESEIGTDINITWYMFGRPDVGLLLKHHLINTAGYELFNRGAAFRSGTRFLITSSNKHYQPTHLSHVGTILTVQAEELEYALDVESGFYGWQPTDQIIELVFDLSTTSNISSTDKVHQVIYTTASTNEAGVWYYNESTEDFNSGPSNDEAEYPTIYGSVEFVDYSNESFPFAMVIEEGKQVIKGHLGDAYKTSTEEMLNIIDLNLDALMGSLTGEGGTDGDVNEDVKDAVVMYAVNFDSDANGILQYIFEHFREYYEANNTRMDSAHTHWKNNLGQADWRNKFTNGGQMGFFNNRFQFMIRFRWMTMQIKSGLVTDTFSTRPTDSSLGSVTYTTGIDSGSAGNVTLGWPHGGDADPSVTPVEIGKITKHLFEGQEYAADSDNPQSINDHLYILRKQLTAGNDGTDGNPVVQPTYVEMVIMGLTHESRLVNPDGYFQTNSGEVLHIITTIWDTNSSTGTADGKFFMPVSVNVLNNFNSIVQSEILYSSLTLALTLYSEEKLPWYADAALMLALRVVLILATWGNSEAWLQGIWEVIQQFVVDYLIQLAVLEALTLLIDLVGGEVALVLAAIAVAVAAFSGDGSKGFNILTDLLSAEDLMKSATLLIDAVNASVEQDFLDLQADIEAQQELEEDRAEELAALKAELGPSTTIDMVDVVVRQPTPNFYEEPGDFYNRTVHITNPGVLSLDTIDSYVGNALTLPRLNTD